MNRVTGKKYIFIGIEDAIGDRKENFWYELGKEENWGLFKFS